MVPISRAVSGLDAHAEDVLLEVDLVAAVQLAVAEARLYLLEQHHSAGPCELGQGVQRGPQVRQAALLGLVCHSVGVAVAVEDDAPWSVMICPEQVLDGGR